MAAAYAKDHPDSKSGVKNSWNTKMQKHCAGLAKDADKLAADAEKRPSTTRCAPRSFRASRRAFSVGSTLSHCETPGGRQRPLGHRHLMCNARGPCASSH
jgi:hypothetical protein